MRWVWGSGEVLLDSGYISKAAPTELTDGLHVGCERQESMCGARAKGRVELPFTKMGKTMGGAGLGSHGNQDIGFEHSKFEKPGRD